MVAMRVAELWRYPVKSMAGERLERALVTPSGVAGDRVVHVADARGRVVTARTHPRLLAHQGALDPDGEPLIDGRPWTSAEAASAVRAAAGDDARLVRWDGPERFDVLPLLVATDGAVAEFGRDIRRLRPNILIGGVPGMEERGWPGGELHIGDVVIRLDSLRPRCPMTTVDPDTLARDPEVLRDIGRRFGGRLALNAEVVRPGPARIGDPVVFVTHRERGGLPR